MLEGLMERLKERFPNVCWAFDSETVNTPLKGKRVVFGTPQVKMVPLVGQNAEKMTMTVTVWTTESKSQSCADFAESVRKTLINCDSEGLILKIEQDKCVYDTTFLAMKCVLHLTLCDTLEEIE